MAPRPKERGPSNKKANIENASSGTNVPCTTSTIESTRSFVSLPRELRHQIPFLVRPEYRITFTQEIMLVKSWVARFQ